MTDSEKAIKYLISLRDLHNKHKVELLDLLDKQNKELDEFSLSFNPER